MTVRCDESLLCCEILHQDFATKQAKNPSFSMRAYAAQLRMSPATLSRILSGKRKISKKSTKRILDHLRIQNPILAQRIEEKIRLGSQQRGFTRIDAVQSNILSEWFYFAILSLAETRGFISNAQWIAQRLNLTESKVKKAIAELKELGFLLEDECGRLTPRGVQLTTTDQVVNLSARRMNHQSVSLAKTFLEEKISDENLDDCYFSGMTMAIDPANLPIAKERIKRFRRSICELLESGEKSEVYRLNFSLFPLTDEVI